MGTTEDLSAVGITAIGSTVGGILAASVVITTAAPIAAATAVGYGIYKFIKWKF